MQICEICAIFSERNVSKKVNSKKMDKGTKKKVIIHKFSFYRLVFLMKIYLELYAA